MKALLESLDRRLNRLQAHQSLADLAISDSGFVFAPASGRSFVANETAMAILQELRTVPGITTLVKRLTDHFDVSCDDALLALEPFVQELEDMLS